MEGTTESSFLLVFQTPHQQRLLIKYGNVITCMNAFIVPQNMDFHVFFWSSKHRLALAKLWAPLYPSMRPHNLLQMVYK